MPDPEPIAPIKSEKIVNKPTHIPPTEAATGIYLCNMETIDLSLIPTKDILASVNYLTLSLVLSPEISIQILAKKAHVAKINTV